MSAKQFNYFDDAWKAELLECPKCQWLGTFEQSSVEYYDQLMDCHCPRCSSLEAPMLAIVSYPTLEEARANADKPGIREWVQQIDAGLDKFAREKLQGPEQLPEIGEDSFTLEWDNDHSNTDDRRTLIKHGETVIFSEPARYEEYERFEEVAEILKAKYGGRLKDLVPTLESEYWLYGDKHSAPDYVDSVRDKLRSQSGTVNSGVVTALQGESSRDKLRPSVDRLPVQSLLQFEPKLPIPSELPKRLGIDENHPASQETPRQRSTTSESPEPSIVSNDHLESRHPRSSFHKGTYTKRVLLILVGCALVLAASVVLQDQRHSSAQPAPVVHQSAPVPVEQTLHLTGLNSLAGGSEAQRLDGTCSMDTARESVTCDIHNGFPDWKITEIMFFVRTEPAGAGNAYRQRVSIAPFETATLTFRLGMQVDAPTWNRQWKTWVNHWSWDIAEVKGIARR